MSYIKYSSSTAAGTSVETCPCHGGTHPQSLCSHSQRIFHFYRANRSYGALHADRWPDYRHWGHIICSLHITIKSNLPTHTKQNCCFSQRNIALSWTSMLLLGVDAEPTSQPTWASYYTLVSISMRCIPPRFRVFWVFFSFDRFQGVQHKVSWSCYRTNYNMLCSQTTFRTEEVVRGLGKSHCV